MIGVCLFFQRHISLYIKMDVQTRLGIAIWNTSLGHYIPCLDTEVG